MKNYALIILISLISFGGFSQNKVNWVTVEKAQELNEKAPKKIFIDVYTKWCGPCKMFSRTTLKDSAVVAYLNEHFYSIKFDGEGADSATFNGKVYKNPNHNPESRGRNSMHQLTPVFAANPEGKVFYPTVAFLNSDLTMLTNTAGVIDAKKFLIILHFLNEEAYKTTTFDKYFAKKSN